MAVRSAPDGMLETVQPPEPDHDSDGAQAEENTFSESELTETVGAETDDEIEVSQLEAAANYWEQKFGWEETSLDDASRYNVMQAVRMIGGGVIGIAVIVIVVNEVLTTGAVNNSTGPFSGVIDSLETTGVSAMVLLVVGLLVAAASRLMGFFGGGF